MKATIDICAPRTAATPQQKNVGPWLPPCRNVWGFCRVLAKTRVKVTKVCGIHYTVQVTTPVTIEILPVILSRIGRCAPGIGPSRGEHRRVTVAAPPLGIGQDRRMWNFPALALQEDSHLKALSAQKDQIDEHLQRTQKVLESWQGQIGSQTCTQPCLSSASASLRPQALHPKSSLAQVIETERVVNKLQYKVCICIRCCRLPVSLLASISRGTLHTHSCLHEGVWAVSCQGPHRELDARISIFAGCCKC